MIAAGFPNVNVGITEIPLFVILIAPVTTLPCFAASGACADARRARHTQSSGTTVRGSGRTVNMSVEHSE